MNSIANYFKEARVELQKVIWPTRKETTHATLMVIGMSAFVAIFLGGLDLLFITIVKQYVLGF